MESHAMKNNTKQLVRPECPLRVALGCVNLSSCPHRTCNCQPSIKEDPGWAHVGYLHSSPVKGIHKWWIGFMGLPPQTELYLVILR